jgi:hypothetical protein
MSRIAAGGVTRRAVLSGGGSCAGAATLLALGITGAAAAKLSQTAVAYQTSPKGNLKCETCAVFQSPDACQLVDGTISAEGWCKVYRPK